jgi:hypothetical protein
MYILPIITKTVIIFPFGALVFGLHSTNTHNRTSLIIPCNFAFSNVTPILDLVM